jgi:putative addiction module antidote
MLDLKVRKVGNSLGFVLPREAASRMKVHEGDTVFLTETADGGYKITPYDPDFEVKMKKAEEIMSRYRNTLRALAK